MPLGASLQLVSVEAAATITTGDFNSIFSTMPAAATAATATLPIRHSKGTLKGAVFIAHLVAPPSLTSPLHSASVRGVNGRLGGQEAPPRLNYC